MLGPEQLFLRRRKVVPPITRDSSSEKTGITLFQFRKRRNRAIGFSNQADSQRIDGASYGADWIACEVVEVDNDGFWIVL